MVAASDNTDLIMQGVHATILATPPVYVWVYTQPEQVFDKVLQLQQAGWRIDAISTEYYRGWFLTRVQYVLRAHLPPKPPVPPPPPVLAIKIGPITQRPLPSLAIVVGRVSNRPLPQREKPVINFRIGPISSR